MVITVYGVADDPKCQSVVEKVQRLVANLNGEVKWRNLFPCLRGEECIPASELEALRQTYADCENVPVIGIDNAVLSYAHGIRRLQSYNARVRISKEQRTNE